MIKAVKGLSPIYVRYYDNASGSIYNLTEDQYTNLVNQVDNGMDVADKFEVELEGEIGYAPDVVTTLGTIYGFEADSE